MRGCPVFLMAVAIGVVSALDDKPSEVIGIQRNETSNVGAKDNETSNIIGQGNETVNSSDIKGGDIEAKAGKADKTKARPPQRFPWQDAGDPNITTEGSWPLTFHPSPNGHRFTVPVEIGDPPQRFDLDIHTGSATTWVMGENPVTKGGWPVVGKSYYVPGNNSLKMAYKKRFKKFELTHADRATVEGTVYRDRVRIGNKNGIGYWLQDFGVAKTIHPRFASEANFTGFLGLGLKEDLGKDLPPNLLTTLQNTDKMVGPKFSLTFKEEGGRMHWGARNESLHLYVGNLFKTWLTHIVPKGASRSYHAFNTTALYIGGKKIRSKKILAAAMDSTSSFIVMPYKMADRFYRTAGGKGSRKVLLPTGHEGWQVPCAWNPPNLTVQITNYTTDRRTGEEKLWSVLNPPHWEHKFQVWKNFTIPSENLRLQETEPGLCLGAVVARTGKDTPHVGPGKLMRNKDQWPEIILGWPFLKDKYIAFDHVQGIYFGEAS